MTPHETISLKIADLHDAIVSVNPRMPTLLREIHANLKTDSDLVTLLSPEEISIIVSGLSKQTSTTIMTSILSGGKGKALKKVGLDDI